MSEPIIPSIYAMKFHESIRHDRCMNLEVIRVPGGWLYIYHADDANPGSWAATTSCFVPYSDEFRTALTLVPSEPPVPLLFQPDDNNDIYLHVVRAESNVRIATIAASTNRPAQICWRNQEYPPTAWELELIQRKIAAIDGGEPQCT